MLASKSVVDNNHMLSYVYARPPASPPPSYSTLRPPKSNLNPKTETDSQQPITESPTNTRKRQTRTKQTLSNRPKRSSPSHQHVAYKRYTIPKPAYKTSVGKSILANSFSNCRRGKGSMRPTFVSVLWPLRQRMMMPLDIIS